MSNPENDKVAELEAMIAQMEGKIKAAELLIENCKTQIAALREHVNRIRSLPST
jgi:ribosome-interacting GTPase 1